MDVGTDFLSFLDEQFAEAVIDVGGILLVCNEEIDVTLFHHIPDAFYRERWFCRHIGGSGLDHGQYGSDKLHVVIHYDADKLCLIGEKS